VDSHVIMHMDLDYFYAQCEERENPSLKGKAVVVCVYSGRSAHSGAVGTANYIARGYGVKAGMPISLAENILQNVDAAFIPVNYKLYEQFSENVMALLRNYGESFEQASIDEAYLDVTGKVNGNFEVARKLASHIKEEIKIKEGLTCSIGVGPNKLIAKMSSDFKKPDGLTVIEPNEVRNFLFPLPVGKLYGVGKKTEEKMATLGIKTIKDLAHFNPDRLAELFRGKLGLYFHRASNGLDDEPVQERGEAEQISRMTTLKENTRELPQILPELKRLAHDVYIKVTEQELDFTSVSIIAIMEDMSTHSKTKSLEAATPEKGVIYTVAEKLFQALLKERSELNVRRIGVRVAGLTKRKGQKPLHNFLS